MAKITSNNTDTDFIKEVAQWAIQQGFATGHADTLESLLSELSAEVDLMQTQLSAIRMWADAYPFEMFPEPDWEEVKQALEAKGIGLDQVSASCMRRVIIGVKDILKMD